MSTPTHPSQPLPEPLQGVYVPSLVTPTAPEDLLRELAAAQWEARSSAALLEILGQAENCERLEQACQTLVNCLQTFLNCRRVALAICRQDPLDLRVLVLSGTVSVDRTSDQGRRWEAALAETALRRTVNEYPSADQHAAAPLLAHRQLLHHDRLSWIVSTPLALADGTLVGAWLLAGDEARGDGQTLRNFASAAAPPIAATLGLMRRAQRRRWPRRLTQLWNQPRWRFWSTAALILLLMLATLIPTPYSIRAQARVEPVSRRTVCAPFEGVLESSLVEPGDIVEEGQVLARMDDQANRLEAMSIEAERQRAEIQRSSAVARHELGAARLAELEVARLDLRLQLHTDRSEQLLIKSPIAGAVLQGDQKRAEGAPVSLGQRLFEIAPLETMVFEVAIAEREYAHAAVGQPVVVRLDAYPGKRWRGVIKKIHPRSEKWDNDYVFVAEFRAPNHSGLLRPGMNGNATVTGARHPWIWNVGHKAWQSVVGIFGL